MRLSLRSRPFFGEWQVLAVTLFTAIIGITSIITAGTPAIRDRLTLLHTLVPVSTVETANLITVMIGFILLILANSLWNRKRTGWLLTIMLLIVVSVTHLFKGLDYEESIIALGLAAWLGALRPHFHARSDSPSVKHALLLLTIATGFVLLYGTLGFTLLTAQYETTPRIDEALIQTIRLFVSPQVATPVAVTAFGNYFTSSVYLIALITVSSALLLLTRSVVMREPATGEERQRAASIVHSYGRSSLAALTLLEDKSYFFSPGGSVVAYVVKNGFAVALGDPIGPATDTANAIRDFRTHCREYGWRTAFYQVLPDHFDLYRAQKFKALPIGQEAIIDLRQFTLSGNARKSLRQHFNRIAKQGYTTTIYEPPLDDELVVELQQISDEWMAATGGTEKRFSLGWFDDGYIRAYPVIVAADPDGNMVAFANILPEYQRNEATLDLMRYRTGVPPGVMDFLFVSLFQWAQAQGYDSFNLGLVALAGIGESRHDPAVERALHYMFNHLNQFYNFKGLYNFKAKFQPQWSMRYLIYPGAATLPALGVALVRADSGDDFVWTYLRELRTKSTASMDRAAQVPT